MDFISVWDSNPLTIGLRYIQHLFETKRLTFNIRMDCGTETGKLAAIHAFLCDNRDDVDDSTDLVIQGWISPYKFLVPCLSVRVKFTNQ